MASFTLIISWFPLLSYPRYWTTLEQGFPSFSDPLFFCNCCFTRSFFAVFILGSGGSVAGWYKWRWKTKILAIFQMNPVVPFVFQTILTKSKSWPNIFHILQKEKKKRGELIKFSKKRKEEIFLSFTVHDFPKLLDTKRVENTRKNYRNLEKYFYLISPKTNLQSWKIYLSCTNLIKLHKYRSLI